MTPETRPARRLLLLNGLFVGPGQNLNKTCIQSGESFVLTGPLTHLATMATTVATAVDPLALTGVSEGGVVADSLDTGADIRVDWIETDPGLSPVHRQSPSSFSPLTAALI